MDVPPGAEQVLRHGELTDAGGLRPQLSCVLPADWAALRHTEATCTALRTTLPRPPTPHVRRQHHPARHRNLIARDLHCVARGCTRPPATCDTHHLRHRADGGATTTDNLVLLCRRHHVLWHQGRLQLHHLHVPWHPEQAGAPPDPFDELCTRAGP